jgi:hypothetical protein
MSKETIPDNPRPLPDTGHSSILEYSIVPPTAKADEVVRDLWETKEAKRTADLHDPVPDFVKLPQDLGGKQLRVLQAVVAPCIMHPEHQCRHLFMEDDFGVAECDSYYWYRRKA